MRLSFDDPELEAAWWAWNAEQRGRVLRGGMAVLAVGILVFAPFDLVLYPSVAWRIWVVRALTVAAMAPAAPACFGPRSRELLARWGQEWLLYVCAVTFAGIATIGVLIAPTVQGPLIYAPVLAMCIVIAGLYGVTGLRFRYAAPLGIGATILLVTGALRLTDPPASIWAAIPVFGGGFNAVGLIINWTIEQQARRAFLRGRELAAEQARAEALLLNVMPKAWADRLGSTTARVDRVAEATVLFATIIGFDTTSDQRPALDTVALLDRLVGRFDLLAIEAGVERIKTIGSTYMAGAGLSTPNVDHAVAVVRLALAMRDALAEAGLTLRVGVCSGPVVVGVVGRTRYAFDVWGDTVNTASRLDGAAGAGEILVSGWTAERLGPRWRLAPRGPLHLKGKGEVPAFLVEGR